MTYKVFVDDNYHYMDEDYRYELGTYASYDEAVQASKKIVDEFLIENKSTYGEDPFIVSKETFKKFSARTYAPIKCKELFESK